MRVIRKSPFVARTLCRLAAALSWLPFTRRRLPAPRAPWEQESACPRRPPARSAFAAYLAGFGATWTSVFSYVLFGTYMGIGALAHDFGFTVTWALASTMLVWAGPAQVILISTLGAGASLLEVGHCGRALQRAAAADGGRAAADAEGSRRAQLEAAAAGAFHRGQHVGRGAAPPAAAAARGPRRVLQRARQRLS